MKFSMASDEKISERPKQLEEIIVLLCPEEEYRPIILTDRASINDIVQSWDEREIMTRLRERFGDRVNREWIFLDLPDLLQKLYGDLKR